MTFSKPFLVHFLDCLYSCPCHPASPSTAASVMLGGRPHRTARPARWTGMSAASCQHLAQRLRSVSTLWALSIVGLARQVRRHVCAQPRAAQLWRQPAKVPEPIGFCCRIRPWLEVSQPTCVSFFTNSRLSSCCKNSATEMGGLESNTGGRASRGGGEAKHFIGWLDLRPKRHRLLSHLSYWPDVCNLGQIIWPLSVSTRVQ